MGPARHRSRLVVAMVLVAGGLLWLLLAGNPAPESPTDATPVLEGRSPSPEPGGQGAEEEASASPPLVVPAEPAPSLPGAVRLRASLLRAKTPVPVAEVRLGARIVAAFDPPAIEPRVVLPAGETLTLIVQDARAATEEVTFVLPADVPEVFDVELPAADDARLDPLAARGVDARSGRPVVAAVLHAPDLGLPRHGERPDKDGWIRVDRATQVLLVEQDGWVSAPGYYPRAWRGAAPAGLPRESWRVWDRSGVLPFPLRPHEPDDAKSPLVGVRLVRPGTPARPTAGRIRVRSAMDPDYHATFDVGPSGLATFAPPPVFACDVWVDAALVGTFAFVRDVAPAGSVRDVVVPEVERHDLDIQLEEVNRAALARRAKEEQDRRTKDRPKEPPEGTFTARFFLLEVTPLDDLGDFAEAETRYGSRAGLLAIEPGAMRLASRLTWQEAEVLLRYGEGTRFRVTFRRAGEPETRGLDGAAFPRRDSMRWQDIPVVR